MKRAYLFVVLLLLTLILATATAQADDLVVIKPYLLGDNEVISVGAGDQVIIEARWVACTRGLTQAFRNAAVISLDETFEGQMTSLVEPPGRQYWSALAPFPNDVSDYCQMETRNGWVTIWHYELGQLAPGQHEMHFIWTLANPIPDGGDYDGNGFIDLFSSDNFHHDNTFVIDVS